MILANTWKSNIPNLIQIAIKNNSICLEKMHNDRPSLPGPPPSSGSTISVIGSGFLLIWQDFLALTFLSFFSTSQEPYKQFIPGFTKQFKYMLMQQKYVVISVKDQLKIPNPLVHVNTNRFNKV